MTVIVRNLFRYWLPLMVWVLLIFLGSGDQMSAEHTSRFLVPFLIWLKGDISAETLALVHFVMRKSAHVTEYLILALLLCRAIFRGTNVKWARSSLFVGAWIACLLVATADEFRQSFVQSREASPWDVMIDNAGAIFGLLLYSGWIRRRPAGRIQGPK